MSSPIQHRAVIDTTTMLEHLLSLLDSGETEEAKELLLREICKRKTFLRNSGTVHSPSGAQIHSKTNVDSGSDSNSKKESNRSKPEVLRFVSAPGPSRSRVMSNNVRERTGATVENPNHVRTPPKRRKTQGFYKFVAHSNINISKSAPNTPNCIKKSETQFLKITEEPKQLEAETLITELTTIESTPTCEPELEETSSIPGIRNDKQTKNFNMIVAEVLQTERDYVRDLQIVVDVFIDPLEKGNLIPRATVDALFSNWRSLLGINQELIYQMEGLPKKKPTKETEAVIESEIVTSSKTEPNILVRVTFGKDRASKTLLVNSRHTGNDLVKMAVRKVVVSLPAAEQQSFKTYYENCELYDDKMTYNLNERFMDQIHNIEVPPVVTIRKAHKQATDIGDCFLQLATYIQLYSEYCNNQVAAAQLLDKLRDNQQFWIFIEDCQFDNPLCRKRDLSSFLIIPLQRICKYPLLLKRLLENTPESCDEYKNLAAATNLLTEAVQTINNKKRDIEGSQKMLSLQNNLICKGDLELFSPSRKYICDDTTELIINGSFTPATYFLFNDLILTAMINQHGKFTVQEHLELIDARIDSVTGRPQAVQVSGRPEDATIIFNFEDLYIKADFMKLVSNTIYEARKGIVTTLYMKQNPVPNSLSERYYSWVTTQKLRGFVINKTLEEWLEMFFPS